MSKKEAMVKCDKDTSALKMKNMTGSAQNYEHEGEKAERFCHGGYVNGGKVKEG